MVRIDLFFGRGAFMTLDSTLTFGVERFLIFPKSGVSVASIETGCCNRVSTANTRLTKPTTIVSSVSAVPDSSRFSATLLSVSKVLSEARGGA